MNPPFHPIGIIGGMGPHAGFLLAERVASATRAQADGEHLPIALLSYPDRMPDRTAYLEGKTPHNPATRILDVAAALSQLGARVAGIACNTAHAPPIFDVVSSGLAERAPGLRLLHLVRETAAFSRECYPDARRIGVLATLGTYRTGLYETALRDAGFEAVLPAEEERETLVHRAIYDPVFGIKARPDPVDPRAIDLLLRAMAHLSDRGCDALVLGCTELSVAFGMPGAAPLPLVDATTALARALVRETAPERLRPIANSPEETGGA